MRVCASTLSVAETAQAVSNAKGIAVGSLFTLEKFPRGSEPRASDPVGEPRPGVQRAKRCRSMKNELPQLRVAMSSQQQFRRANHGEAVRPGRRRRWWSGSRRRNLQRRSGRVKVRPLGPVRARKTRTARAGFACRRCGAGWGRSRRRESARGDRRFPRRHPTADHHRQRAQRREQAAPYRCRERAEVEYHKGKGSNEMTWTTRRARKVDSRAIRQARPSSTIRPYRQQRLHRDDQEKCDHQHHRRR